MDDLIKLVSQKTGLFEDMARTAVDTVVGYQKERLPAPIAGQVDDILGGAGAREGLEDLAKGLGGILGKK